MNEKELPRISFEPAYSGGLLQLDRSQWSFPVVFDVSGIEENVQKVPILRDHDQSKKVGQTDYIDYDNGQINARGRLLNLGVDKAADEVYELWKRGSEMQASVSTGLIDPADIEFVEEGREVFVNGQNFHGPIEIVRKWKLKEISVVTLGADDAGTRVRIGEAMRATEGGFIATRGKRAEIKEESGGIIVQNKKRYKIARALFGRLGKAADETTDVVDFLENDKKELEARRANALRAYAEEMGVKEEDITEEERKTLLAAFAALDEFRKEEVKEDVNERIDAAAEDFEEKRTEIVEEVDDERFREILYEYAKARGVDIEDLTEDEIKIVKMTVKVLAPEKEVEAASDTEKSGCAAFTRSGAAAWSKTKYPADVIGRFGATIQGMAMKRPNACRVAEAAMLTCHGNDPADLKKCGYTDTEIDEATTAKNRNLSLLGLMYRAGVASVGDHSVETIASGLKKAQFQSMLTNTTGYRTGRAAGELSTVDIPNILSNVMHKSLILGLLQVDDPTDRLARVVNARDFRDQYFINLLTAGEFADVKPNGELENLKLSDFAYTNRAKMRGFELRLGYEAIANDDMNAVAEIPRIMGRKAALRKQKIFFEALVGASPTAITGNPTLTLAGLDKGLAAFRAIKDGDGDPLGLRPKVLLVPPALEQTALSFVTARDIVQGDTGSPTGLAIVPNASRYAGRFEVIVSEYLGTGSPFSSSWGDKKWALIADPYDVPLMILSYYQNQRQPTLKTVYGEAEIEGLKFKCWWGFGVSVAETKGAVVSNPS